eukprot:TRINITY_DN1843_c0_g2_i1.p1 TRINITY_DN1843_c0_g2~~TRINITY_DN1843_c0_g2_i1.p1  ORF type:complete len:226 (-),score=28.24 TRINITY_DN1843_c0_g2_i1:163-840(-)
MFSATSLKPHFVRPTQSSCAIPRVNRGRLVVTNVGGQLIHTQDFIQETLQAFDSQEKQIANVEEARVLFKEGGYTFLDVRPALEADMIGKLTGSTTIPYKIAKKKFVDNKMVLESSDNENFAEEVQKKIPNKDTKIIVCDTNGKKYALEVLAVLDGLEYTHLVGLKGGFFSWYRTWDNKLNRRVFQEYAETYTHDGDSAGIHSSGAGFERMDKSGMEAWQMFLDL